MFWGFSPAIDFLEEACETESLKHKNELNILVIGAADSRHVLKTISRYYRHEIKQVNFYVFEVLLELTARQLLLLLTAFEPSDKLDVFDKSRLWMELYGNTLLRPNTSSYLIRKAHQLIHIVTDNEYLKFKLPVVSIEFLKYKERDCLETIFQFWRGKNFNIVSLWDGRLRQSLGVRYDTKDGVFDWDYHMKLKEVDEGKRINYREYKHWRSSGVAFTWLETESSQPNTTLASGVVKLGDRILHHGYLGDIVCPPYVNFGVECDDEEMLKTRNGVPAHRATDITERNLNAMFYEIEHQIAYTQKHRNDRELGVVITELTETNLQKLEMNSTEKEAETKTDDHVMKKETYPSMPVKQTKIFFLPTTALLDYPKKPKFKKLFDVVYVGQNLIQRLTPDVMTMANDDALLLVETRKFVTAYSKKQQEEYVEYATSLCKDCGCELLKPFHGLKDSLAKFQLKRK